MLQKRMTFSLRHKILLTGIFLVIISFLWFGRGTDTYNILFLTGLIISFFSFLTILIKSDTRRSKLLWTVIIVVAIGFQWLTEPLLIKLSYRLFINRHEQELQSVTNLILKKKSAVFILLSSEFKTGNGYTKEEADFIKEQLKKTNIHFISKDSLVIFYRTWGMLDVSHGIYYSYTDKQPNNRYKKIIGNWYY